MAGNVVGRYAQGVLTGERLQEAINGAADSLATEENELAQIGVTPAELASAHFVVKQEGGFIAEGIILTIAIGAGGNLTAEAAKALWKTILRRVKDDRGEDAIGPEAQPERRDKEK